MNEIKIYQKNYKTVVAEQNGVSASARCHPEDKFDFAIGAKLALERLLEIIKPFKVGDKVIINDRIGIVDFIYKKREVAKIRFGKNEICKFVLDDIKHFTFKPHLISSNGYYYGNIGEETDFTDVEGNKLHVGDIVIISTRSYSGVNGDLVFVCKESLMGYDGIDIKNGEGKSEYGFEIRDVKVLRSYKWLSDGYMDFHGVTAVLTED